jgi:1-deoxy-D-xylulose-5-phosphate reductoisomerase
MTAPDVLTPLGVAILGSTGSIGKTALRVLGRQSDRFRVAALTSYRNAALLCEQVDQFRPSFVGIVMNGTEPHPPWSVGPECLVGRRIDRRGLVLNAVVRAADSTRHSPR